jgi:hypothetical protein
MPPPSYTVKIEAIFSSETLDDFHWTTWRYIPEAREIPVHILPYGSKTWVSAVRNVHKIQVGKMKCLRNVKGCTRLQK